MEEDGEKFEFFINIISDFLEKRINVENDNNLDNNNNIENKSNSNNEDII